MTEKSECYHEDTLSHCELTEPTPCLMVGWDLVTLKEPFYPGTKEVSVVVGSSVDKSRARSTSLSTVEKLSGSMVTVLAKVKAAEPTSLRRGKRGQIFVCTLMLIFSRAHRPSACSLYIRLLVYLTDSSSTAHRCLLQHFLRM